MKQISRGAALLLAAGAFALARPTAVLAQTKDSTKAPATSPDTATPAVKAAGGISVAVEAGGQDWDRLSHVAPNEQQLGKLLEYRDIKTGLVIPQFLLRYTPKDSVGTYQIEGRNLLQLDQSFWARASQPGLYDAQVRYDGIVHTFSTDARALGTFGNSGRNTLEGPGRATVDMSLVKNTAIREGTTVQFRVEAFNLFNHTNFGLPDNFIGSPTFGQILSAGSPRRLQLALKFLF